MKKSFWLPMAGLIAGIFFSGLMFACENESSSNGGSNSDGGGYSDPSSYTGRYLNVSTDISDSTFSSAKNVKDGFTVYASSGKTVTRGSAKTSQEGEYNFTHNLQLGGAGFVDVENASSCYRAVKFTGKKGETVVVYAANSGSGTRNLVITKETTELDEAGKPICNPADEDARFPISSKSITKFICQLPSTAEYYILSENAGINIWYIGVGDVPPESTGIKVEKPSSGGENGGNGGGTGDSGEKNPSIDNTTNGSSPTDTMIEVGDDYVVSETNGTRTRIIEVTESQIKNKVYASPTGTASGDGTKNNPYNFETAITRVVAGGAVVLLGGTYSYSGDAIKITSSGTETKMKYILPADDATVVFDFSGQDYNSKDTSKNPRGIELQGDWWHIYKIEIKGASDNGLYITGSHNIIELCRFDENRDSGLQIARKASTITQMKDWPGCNLILNSTSYNNSDPATGENADGFAAKLTCGPGNIFDGCISYNNVDDGWDMFAKTATGSIGAQILRNCIAFRNGATAAGVFTADSDGNGFKMGGSGVGSGHLAQNCLSFENKAIGFTDNNNPALSGIVNCTAYDNGKDEKKANFVMERVKNDYVVYKNVISFAGRADTSDGFVGTGINVLYYTNDKKYRFADNKELVKNYKDAEVVTPTASELFVSTTSPANGADVHTLWRNADGTINTHGFLEPKGTGKYAGMGAKFGTQADVVLNISLDLN